LVGRTGWDISSWFLGIYICQELSPVHGVSFVDSYITLWPNERYEGQSAKRTEIGSIRKITGIISAISAFPAAVIKVAWWAVLTSSTWRVKTSDRDVPLSFARIKVSQNLRIEVELTSKPSLSSA
jgi:hypothetical protein